MQPSGLTRLGCCDFLFVHSKWGENRQNLVILGKRLSRKGKFVTNIICISRFPDFLNLSKSFQTYPKPIQTYPKPILILSTPIQNLPTYPNQFKPIQTYPIIFKPYPNLSKSYPSLYKPYPNPIQTFKILYKCATLRLNQH